MLPAADPAVPLRVRRMILAEPRQMLFGPGTAADLLRVGSTLQRGVGCIIEDSRTPSRELLDSAQKQPYRSLLLSASGARRLSSSILALNP